MWLRDPNPKKEELLSPWEVWLVLLLRGSRMKRWSFPRPWTSKTRRVHSIRETTRAALASMELVKAFSMPLIRNLSHPSQLTWRASMVEEEPVAHLTSSINMMNHSTISWVLPWILEVEVTLPPINSSCGRKKRLSSLLVGLFTPLLERTSTDCSHVATAAPLLLATKAEILARPSSR
jgi:hypothetical protein